MVLTWRQLGLEHLQEQNPVSVSYLGVTLSMVWKAQCLPGSSLALRSPRAESGQCHISRCYFVSGFESMVPTWRQLGLEHLQEQNPVSVSYLGVTLSMVWKAQCLPGSSLALRSPRAESGQCHISRCYFVSGFESMVLTWRQLGLEHLQEQNPVSVSYLGVTLSMVWKAQCLPGSSLALRSPRAESGQCHISRCYFVSGFESMVLTWRQLGLEHLQEQNPVKVTYLVLFCLWFRKHSAYQAAAWPWASPRPQCWWWGSRWASPEALARSTPTKISF